LTNGFAHINYTSPVLAEYVGLLIKGRKQSTLGDVVEKRNMNALLL